VRRGGACLQLFEGVDGYDQIGVVEFGKFGNQRLRIGRSAALPPHFDLQTLVVRQTDVGVLQR
jgi:hypothetical protein